MGTGRIRPRPLNKCPADGVIRRGSVQLGVNAKGAMAPKDKLASIMDEGTGNQGPSRGFYMSAQGPLGTEVQQLRPFRPQLP
jgi:hypothetical protein